MEQGKGMVLRGLERTNSGQASRLTLAFTMVELMWPPVKFNNGECQVYRELKARYVS